MAQSLNGNANPNAISQEQVRGEEAALDGHDADIYIETPSVASTDVFTTPTQESHPAFPPHAPSDGVLEAQHQSAPIIAPPDIPSSLSIPNQRAPSSATDQDVSSGLAPSTVAQWVPNKVLTSASEDQITKDGSVQAALGGERSTNNEKSSTTGQDVANTWTAPEVASSFPTNLPSSAPEAATSANAEKVPQLATVASTPIKTEAVPVSIPLTAPEHEPESTTHVATPSDREAAFGTYPGKVTASRGLGQDPKGSPASSNLEKEVDIEAGHPNHKSDEKGLEATITEANSNIVDWDGPDDVKNPMNWSEKLKWANVAVIASITFLTQVAIQLPPRAQALIYHDRSQSLGIFHARTGSP